MRAVLNNNDYTIAATSFNVHVANQGRRAGKGHNSI